MRPAGPNNAAVYFVHPVVIAVKGHAEIILDNFIIVRHHFSENPVPDFHAALWEGRFICNFFPGLRVRGFLNAPGDFVILPEL